MGHIKELLIKTRDTAGQVRRTLGIVSRPDIHVTQVGQHYDGCDVFYVFSEEELFVVANEEFLLNYFDTAGSSPWDFGNASHCYDHCGGVFFSWRKPMINDRFMCILFAEGIEGVNDVEVALGKKWPEPCGGIVIDTEWNDIHFIDFNWTDMKLPDVFLTLEGAYDPKEGYGAYRRHLSVVHEFIQKNPLPAIGAEQASEQTLQISQFNFG